MKQYNPTRLDRLIKRQQIIAVIRQDLYDKGFLEVETPILVKNTTPDAYIDSINVGENYLITSTEYQVKRLISEGVKNVFTLSKNFRANDRGRFHSVEFTMLEWGRALATLQEIETDAVQLIQKAFSSLYPKQNSLNFNGCEIEFMNAPWDRLTVREAFKIYLNLDHLEDFSLQNLCSAAKTAGIDLPPDFKKDRSLAISFLLDLLQSHLGKKRPTFLCDWPKYLTSSAPINQEDPFIAQRVELYIGGIEIGNGFPFLTDSDFQQKLFENEQHRRKEIGKAKVAFDNKYLEALNDLPQGAGMAIGMDRLVMVLTEATRLSDVQAFDWDEL